MSILLEVLGRGFCENFRDILRPFYWQENIDSVDSVRLDVYGDMPDDEANLRLGLAHWREERLDEAHELLTASACGNNRNAPARAALACVLTELGEISPALEQLRALDRLLPNQSAIQFATGLCYELLHQPSCAETHYRQAVALDDTLYSARMRLAAVALKEGDLEEAIKQYEALCELIPEETWLRTLLGSLLFKAGQYEQAVEAFETVIAMEPDNWAMADRKISGLMAAGKYREAISYAHEALDEQGPFADTMLQLANLYSMVGDDESAVKYYLETMEVQPNYLEAMVKLATHHLLFGRWEESAEVFGNAAQVCERLTLNYVAMGLAQAAAGQEADAADSFELAAAVEPNSSLMYVQMIRLHGKIASGQDAGVDDIMGQIGSSAESILRDELRCHAARVLQAPDCPETRFNYGVLLRSADRSAEAMREFLSAIRACPSHVSSLMRLGLLLRARHRQANAAKVFHRILKSGDEQIDFHYQLALQFLRPGGIEEMAEKMTAEMENSHGEGADARSSLAAALIQMGLLDRSAATWRALRATHQVGI